jgi:alpha-amylase
MTGGEDLGVTYTNYATHTDAPQFNKTADDFHPSTNAHNDLVFPYHHNEGFGTVVETNSYGVDVAFLSPNMRLGLKHWGNWLANTIGIQGWRLDFTEGVEPWYIWEWLHYRGIRDGFAFIEYWEESDGREMQEWIDLIGRKAAIYDSHLRSMLKEMCEDGASFDMRQLNAPSLLGLEPGHVVVYLDNHDTFRRNDLSKLGIQANKPLGYAYLFHSKGYPLVFWRDYYDFAYLNNDGTPNWSIKIPEEIDRLIAIRKVTVGGSLKFLYADDDLYIQQRDGGESKSGSILVMNDSSTIKSNSVQTMWINTDIIDLVDTNSPHQVTTDGSGYAYLEAPGEGYRIYAPTNVMEQVNNWRTGP